MHSFKTKDIFLGSIWISKRSFDRICALELVDIIILNIDKMETLIKMFCDLSKAFNNLEHKIPLYN